MQAIKKTKIIATIGPACDSEKGITDLILAGVNIFRFNTKHGTPDWHEKRIQRVEKVAGKLDLPIGILIDLQGPEIRIETKDKLDVIAKKGEKLDIAYSFSSSSVNLAIPHPSVFKVLKPGDTLLIDDGMVESRVVSVSKDKMRVEILNNSTIKHRKGVNLPGKLIELPSLIESDLKQLEKAAINKIDFVALSFSRTKEDIEVLRAEMKKRGINAHIIAKIESQPAITNIDELIKASDAIMVARGDLGVEVPIEQLAYWQKEIITKCRIAKKPVITATQMLESMIKHPRPTRAEATDVANAVLDGTDAIMLSAETAVGKFPLQAVEFMTKIAKYNESISAPPSISQAVANDSTTMIINAAASILETVNHSINKVIILTETGYTARTLSRHRVKTPIIAVTDKHKTVDILTLTYGVSPHYTQFPAGEIESPTRIMKRLESREILTKGETILLIHGKTWKIPGLTNSLTIHKV